MQISKISILALSLSLFLGCGSDSDSSTTNIDIGAGTYVDSAVNGVHYACGIKQGTTGDTGVAGGFSFELGEPCTFSINNIELSKIDGDKLTTKSVEVKVGDIAVAKFLQSLDKDGDPDTNGITIDSKAVEVLAEKNIQEIPSSDADLQNIVTLLNSSNIGYAAEAKSTEEAQKHMAGFSVNILPTKTKLFEGEELELTAVIDGSTSGLTYNWAGAGLSETSQTFKTSSLPSGTNTIIVYVTKDDITISDSIIIEVTPNSEFIVSINANKTQFTTTENVVLEANATTSSDANLAYTYAWKDGSTVLSSTTNTVNQKFAAGEHHVSVDVTSGDVVKSASVDFNVSDLSDFTITDTTITQNSKNLMWVNADEGVKDANGNVVCLAIHRTEYNESIGYDDSFVRAKTFCPNMNFESATNWRTPTPTELADYIKKTNAANIETKYDKPCLQLLAITSSDADINDGANYNAVTTRFMTAIHPEIETGIIRDHTYTEQDSIIDKYPVGLRCVRNTDGSGGVTVPDTAMTVTIAAVKTSYSADEDVKLTADVQGATETVTYAWSDKILKWKDDKSQGSVISDNVNLSSVDENLTQKFTTIGHHTVTVKVTSNNVVKSASFEFDISDFTDFNRTLYLEKDRVIIHDNLMWVDQPLDLTAVDGKDKCAKIHKVSDSNLTLIPAEFEAGKAFCKDMTFFGQSDWRIPTPSEAKGFVSDSISHNILSVYDATCARLLVITDTSNPDSNDSYATVMSRYSSTPAIDSDLTPNIGIRCVRDN